MSEKNTNAIDYLRWRGDLTFAQDPFNEVDNLLLCIVSYIDFDSVPALIERDPTNAVPIQQVCDRLSQKAEQKGLSTLDYVYVMKQMAASRRFSDVAMFAYESTHDEAREMQFGAVSFLLPDDSVFVAYMGTDRSMIGWKEDFNMSFLSAVPSQERAAEYAAEIAASCPQRVIRIGGHSKGGNLAVWAAANLPEDVQSRLAVAYNNDGPGFSSEFLESEGYRRAADRIRTLIPESSVVGVLMEHTQDYEIIDSSYYAVMQHEPLSWVVLGNQFVHQEKRTLVGKLSDDVLREWLASMTPQVRETFIEAMYEVITKGGTITSLEEIPGGLAGGAAFLKSLAGADEEHRSAIMEGLRLLAGEIRDGMKKSAEEGLTAAKSGLRKLLSEWIK